MPPLSESLEVGRVYRRKTLQNRFGGQRQGGISTPAGGSVILLYTGSSGKSFGYEDYEDDEGVFHYFGEGQYGPMEFKAGNRAIRDHAEAGKELLLFEQERRGFVRYRGAYTCADFRLKEGVPDRDGKPRQAIVFQLVKQATLTEIDEGAGEGGASAADLAALRAAALQGPDKSKSASTSKRRVYKRSAALRSYVLARSQGTCEGCSDPAPFATASGSPYLEPHHVRRVSDGGPDHPAWVIALCPNCHARVHHGADGDSYNEALIAKLPNLEAEAEAGS